MGEPKSPVLPITPPGNLKLAHALKTKFMLRDTEIN
jgi:hypothetical protein